MDELIELEERLETSRLEEVADLLHEDIMDADSQNDSAVMIDKLVKVEDMIKERKSLEIERLKLLEEKRVNENKAKADARKLEIEAKRIEYEKPPEKTKFDRVVDFGKAWGGPIAAGVTGLFTIGGIIYHEIKNGKNLDKVGDFEQTGRWTSTGFRWIKH